MRGLVCAALLALASGAAATEPGGVLVLGDARHREQDRVLVEALRIYTRDLGRSVRLGEGAPASLDLDAIALVAEDGRAAGAEVVVWFGREGGAAILYSLRVATLDLRETAVEADDPPQAARALALKVRALLARRDERGWSVPAVAVPSPSPQYVPPPSPSPAPSSLPPSPSPSPPKPEPVPEPEPEGRPAPPLPPVAITRTPPPRRASFLELTAAYGATVPTTTAWVRHGLTIRVAAPWGRLPLVAFVDAAFTTAPSTTVDGHPLGARIWPVGAGVELRLRRPRWQLAAGPRVSLQIVDATAQGTGTETGSARRYSAGLGLLADATWRFSRYVAAVVSLTVEALVPRVQFLAGGNGATDLGWVQFGFTGGFTVSIP